MKTVTLQYLGDCSVQNGKGPRAPVRSVRGPRNQRRSPRRSTDFLIFGRTRRLQIVEQLAALIHQLDQAAARGMIALVGTEVLTQSVDALREQRDLDFRRSGIFGIAAVLGDYTVLFCSVDKAIAYKTS